MLKFLLNVDKYHQLQFLSNRDPIKSHSKLGRPIVLIQGDKRDVLNRKQRILPRLRVRKIFLFYCFS